MDDKAPFNDIESICRWASGLGYKGVQIPTWDSRCINLKKLLMITNMQKSISQWLKVVELR